MAAYQWLFPTVTADTGTLGNDMVTPWRCAFEKFTDFQGLVGTRAPKGLGGVPGPREGWEWFPKYFYTHYYVLLQILLRSTTYY